MLKDVARKCLVQLIRPLEKYLAGPSAKPVLEPPSGEAYLYEVRLAPSGRHMVYVGRGIVFDGRAIISWVQYAGRDPRIHDVGHYELVAWVKDEVELERLVEDVELSLLRRGVHCAMAGIPLLRDYRGSSARVVQMLDASRHILGHFGEAWNTASDVAAVRNLSPAKMRAMKFAHVAGMGFDRVVASVLLCSALEALAGNPPSLAVAALGKNFSKPDRDRIRSFVHALSPSLTKEECDRFVNNFTNTSAVGSKEYVIDTLGLHDQAELVRELYKIRNNTAHGNGLVAIRAPHLLTREDEFVHKCIKMVLRCVDPSIRRP